MTDLIDRNRLLKEISEVYDYVDEFVTRIIPNIIKNQTSVDAVDVVRCKDCKNAEFVFDSIGLIKKGLIFCAHLGCIKRIDFFCADGERKDDEHDVKAD